MGSFLFLRVLYSSILLKINAASVPNSPPIKLIFAALISSPGSKYICPEYTTPVITLAATPK